MNYYNQKAVEYRLADARRMQRNADFAREVRGIEQRDRSLIRRSLTSRIPNWTAAFVRKNPCDGGAV